MTVFLSSFGGVGWQFFDAYGAVLDGGKIYTYTAGTTTPAVTYTSSTGATPHANPIILLSNGRVPGGEIWLPGGANYKFVLTDADDVLIGTFDNVGTVAAGAANIDSFTGNGAQTAFTLTSAPGGKNATNVYITGVYQQKSAYTLVGSTLTFSAAPPNTATIEVVYF